jgi:ribosomal protein S18 acetylase RimI-like enzyme
VTRSGLAGGRPDVDAVPAPSPEATANALDNPVWASLHGGHAGLAEINGRAARYPADVSPFTALPPGADAAAWADLAALIGPDGLAVLTGPEVRWPDGWTVVDRLDAVQMTGPVADATAEPEAVVLGADDVPEMLDLVSRTRPGPFAARTVELGTYLGIRRGGALVAMAGERLRPPGWAEVSAVCTDPAYRGQGLAGRLISAVAANIQARGDSPFLHAVMSNTAAIRLYERLGFTVRRQVAFALLRPPVAGRANGDGPANGDGLATRRVHDANRVHDADRAGDGGRAGDGAGGG